MSDSVHTLESVQADRLNTRAAWLIYQTHTQCESRCGFQRCELEYGHLGKHQFTLHHGLMTWRKGVRYWLSAALTFVCAVCGAQAPSLVTKSYDNARTSEQRAETILTPANVAKSMTMLPRIPCIGDQIGCEAQPLIDGGVMVLASEANVIRGVVPQGGAAIWQTPPLCTPVSLRNLSGYSGPDPDMWQSNDHAGMMGTGVIDPDTHILYQVATCSRDSSGAVASMQQVVYAVDVRTGNVLGSRVVQASANGMNYSDAPRKQRGALALWQQGGVKFLVMEAGSYSESGPTANGWLLMIDTLDLTVKAAMGPRDGIWGSGQGPAIGSDGSIYVGTGNGSFNGLTDFAESALKLRFAPPTATASAQLSVVGNFTPFLDSQRMCATAALSTAPQVLNAPTGAAPGAHMAMASTPPCDAARGDQDAFLTWTLVERFHQFIGAGKDGIGYVINTAIFPRTQPADFDTAASHQANCNRVQMYLFGWDLGVSPCMVNPSAYPLLFPDDPTQPVSASNPGKTRHQHAPLPQYTAPDGTLYLFASPENSWINAWRADAAGTYHWAAHTDVKASAQVVNGMPGCFTSVSDNNGANGILWASCPLGDANRTRTQGVLYAFDLTQLAQGRMPLLWQSQPYAFSKFAQPVVWNGTVILQDGAGSVMEWVGGAQ